MVRKKGFLVDYSRIEKEIWQMAEPVAAGEGAELIDVEYVKEAGSWYLRIYIDREPPVDHDLCQRVSEAMSAELDKADPISQSYFLEISSPGLERPLKRESDLLRYAGNAVRLKLYVAQNGQKEFEGILGDLQGDRIALETADGLMTFPLDEVAHIWLKADFD